MNSASQERNAEYDRHVIELADLQRRALACRLAEDKRTQLSKITEAAHQRMVEFRTITTPVESQVLTRQAKDTTALNSAASSPDSDSTLCSALDNQRNATS